MGKGIVFIPLGFLLSLTFSFDLKASQVSHTVKNLPEMWETGVRSLGWEDPLEVEMAMLSYILAWSIPWTVQLTHQESDVTGQLTLTLQFRLQRLNICFNKRCPFL